MYKKKYLKKGRHPLLDVAVGVDISSGMRERMLKTLQMNLTRFRSR